MKLRLFLYVSFIPALLLTGSREISAEPGRGKKGPLTSQGETFSVKKTDSLIVSEGAESGEMFASDAGEPVPEIPIQGFPSEESVQPVTSPGAEENQNLLSQGEPGGENGFKSESFQVTPLASKGNQPPSKTISSK